jgi:hypothetical protein
MVVAGKLVGYGVGVGGEVGRRRETESVKGAGEAGGIDGDGVSEGDGRF